jgi:hypothetical protein
MRQRPGGRAVDERYAACAPMRSRTGSQNCHATDFKLDLQVVDAIADSPELTGRLATSSDLPALVFRRIVPMYELWHKRLSAAMDAIARSCLESLNDELREYLHSNPSEYERFLRRNLDENSYGNWSLLSRLRGQVEWSSPAGLAA